jgi:hypothetical protein
MPQSALILLIANCDNFSSILESENPEREPERAQL